MNSRPNPHNRIEATISCQFVAALTDAIDEHSDVIEHGLRKFDLSSHDAATTRVSLRRYCEFFDWLAVELNRPYLGRELAMLGGPETLGAVSYMFLGSKDLEVALRNLGHYLLAVQEGSKLYLEIDGEYAFVDYRILDDRIIHRRQDSEYSIGYTWRLMQLFSKNTCQLTMVEFEHDRPAGSEGPIKRIFGAPVLFRRRANRLHFRTDQLMTPSHSADPLLFPILEAHILESIRALATDETFTDQVNSQLTHLALEQGARAKTVATQLGISEATLYRRLRSEGTSFKRLSDDAAKSLASLLIRQKRLTISAIANRLGYSETAALTRAFRRWFGMSPREYRNSI